MSKMSDALPSVKNDGPLKQKALFQQVETLNRGVRSLYHATEEIQFSKPLPSLLKSILKGLKVATGISRAAIFLFENSDTEQSPFLQGCVSVGLAEKKISALKIPLEADEEDTLLFIHPYSSHEVTATSCYQRLFSIFSEQLNLKEHKVDQANERFVQLRQNPGFGEFVGRRSPAHPA